LLLLARDGRFLFCSSGLQFLHCAMLFEELVEQHRVHRVVAHGVDIASTQYLSGLLLLGLVAKELSMTETSSGMAEEIVWRGTSSQWKNFDVYLLCGLFCWLIVPIFFAVAR
jgi:hypothetical protein